ncbi:MAG: molybdenum cofactor biosynthesis protein MoaE [Sphingomonadaceae bacterium]|nr:molybdenum cofactor biosynthesis protein MoaE [Sphingomonadaceae bacterium]
MILVRVQAEPLDLAPLLPEGGDTGAVVTFTGFVRGDANELGGLVSLTLDHYPAMTERALAAIAAEAERRWPILAGRVVHRVGRMLPGEAIVHVAVASSHRAAAFAAAEFLMDWLKTKAPFWKAEERAGGTTWVEARASDDLAAARWE